MVKFRGVSKNVMTAVQIACDLCVTQQKGTRNVLKNTELLNIQNKVSYV